MGHKLGRTSLLSNFVVFVLGEQVKLLGKMVEEPKILKKVYMKPKKNKANIKPDFFVSSDISQMNDKVCFLGRAASSSG